MRACMHKLDNAYSVYGVMTVRFSIFESRCILRVQGQLGLDHLRQGFRCLVPRFSMEFITLACLPVAFVFCPHKYLLYCYLL